MAQRVKDSEQTDGKYSLCINMEDVISLPGAKKLYFTTWPSRHLDKLVRDGWASWDVEKNPKTGLQEFVFARADDISRFYKTLRTKH